MALTSNDVNALVLRYLLEAGFVHSAYMFSNESQVTKSYPDMAQLPPGSLVRFMQKGLHFLEIEANMKDDRSAPEELYRLVHARDAIRMDAAELKEQVQAERAEAEESDDQEAHTAPAPPQSKQQPDAKQGKAKKAKRTASGLHPSPSRQMATNRQAAHQSPEKDHPAAAVQRRAQQPAFDMPGARDNSAAEPAEQIQSAQLRLAHKTVLDMQNRETRKCMWSPTDAVLASGLGEPEALLWKQAEASASEAYTSTVLAHNQADTDKSSVVECFDWNASGTILATGSMDGVIRLWDPSGQMTKTLQGHKSTVTCLRFSRVANILLSGSVDKTAIVWSEGQQTTTVTSHSGSVCCVAWKNDHYFATASADHLICVHPGNQLPGSSFKGDAPDLTHLTWSPDGDVLVSCCEGGVVTVWNPDEGKALHTLREHSADIEAVEWCPGQQHLLATASQDFSVRLWDAKAGKCLHSVTFTSKMLCLAFQPSGLFLIAGCDDGVVSVVSVSDPDQTAMATCQGAILSVSCDKTGKVVAAATKTKQINLLTLTTQ